LTCALGDCDRAVRRHAEKALRQCGYDVVDGCCKPSCAGPVGGCATGPGGCATNPMPMGPAPTPSAAPTPAPAPAPAPAPPEDKAYFPSRLRDQQTDAHPKSLANMFGLLD
jgi:hypothetical protein